MIKLITGKKGTGKTKILIDEINEAVNASNGNIATVEKGSTIRYSISRKVRWCDTEYYNGFIAGLLASNYDITHVYVDGIFKICGRDYDEFGKVLDKIEALTGRDVTVVFTVSADVEELPESVTKYIK